jgi:hypothetical protein
MIFFSRIHVFVIRYLNHILVESVDCLNVFQVRGHGFELGRQPTALV